MKKARKHISPRPNSSRTILSFPIVAIGASAGGLEVFSQLLKDLPFDTGMAFVLIQHLDPDHTSFLREALTKTTEMPIEEIKKGMGIKPNHVYVIPPGSDISLSNGAFVLHARSNDGKLHMPIDFFFRSLAAECGGQSIGVVLTGNATDGTDGLRVIKTENGVTIAQDPRTAKFNGMPQSAVNAGVVDFCLPLPMIAEELVRLSRHPMVSDRDEDPFSSPEDMEELQKIFSIVRSTIGVDFAEYKLATTRRRLARRMALLKVESLSDYVATLKNSSEEAKLFYEDVLIHVTSFFRDSEVFERLQSDIFPQMVNNKPAGAPIRIWVSGCSTGEEVYSIAISVLEFLGDKSTQTPVQFFGSDVSEGAIEKARAGVYSNTIVRDVSADRLSRFFTKVERGYRIKQAIRDLCVFVRHDLARDPPFSRLDLVSCRNVLIYFDQLLQKRIISTFHYCLNTHGFLLLGRAENVLGQQDLFTAVDKKNKIFSRAIGPSSLRFATLESSDQNARPTIRQNVPQMSIKPTVDVARHVDNLLLAQYAPPGVVVNERMEVLQFRGRTGSFLEAPSGLPQVNLLKMVRDGLLAELRVAFRIAKEDSKSVRREGVSITQNGTTKICNLVVTPITGLPDSKEKFYMVLFEDCTSPVPVEKKVKISPSKQNLKEVEKKERNVAKLEHELSATKEYLQSLNEDHQKANDALGAVNEELVSGNEELQSMNEELETAKEELQSANEELTTVNDELQNRSHEMVKINDDLVNLLNSVELPIVILDLNRRIRRFTPKARVLMNLLPSDVGRPIEDIKFNLSVEKFDQQIAQVIETGTVKESEVQDLGGRWHRLQIRPYKTIDNKVDGVVVSLVDVDFLRRAVKDAEWARDYATSIVEAVQMPLVVLDDKIKVISANQAFYDFFSTTKANTEGKSLHEFGIGKWSISSLHTSLEEILSQHARFQNIEVKSEVSHLGKRVMSLSAHPIRSVGALPSMILFAIEDVTDRRNREQERGQLLHQTQEAKAEAEEANRSKDLFLATLSHELRTPLTSLLLQSQLLQLIASDDIKVTRAATAIEKAAKMQAQLIDDLLDISRIVTGKLRIEFQPLDLSTVVRSAIETVSAVAENKSIVIKSNLDGPTTTISGDPVRLQQVIWNLLTNAIKFTSTGGVVVVTLKNINDHAQIQVVDEGIGIESEFLPFVFNHFTQAVGSATRTHGGLGLGLAIVRHLVELHGGRVSVESPGTNRGSTFTILIPLLRVVSEQSEPKDGGSKIKPLQAPSTLKSERTTLEGLRILVVEDDPGTREALNEMLGQAGAIVRTAGSAREAMRVLTEFTPEDLICDIGMADEDGYTFLSKIRQLGFGAGGNIPALALTAFASEKDRQRAFSAGFQMHLAKPIDLKRLTAALLLLSKEGPSVG